MTIDEMIPESAATAIVELPRRPRVRPIGNWRFLAVGVLAAVLIHAYVLSLLPAVLIGPEVDLAGETVLDTNLENDEISGDPDLPTNYNVDRIEEVSVPGPVNPNEAVGIVEAADNPPVTLPPPPGYGGNTGPISNFTSSDPDLPLAAGLAGPLVHFMAFAGRSGARWEKMLREGRFAYRSESAVARGLKWLVSQQLADGSWCVGQTTQRNNCTGQVTLVPDRQVLATGLALLPFLGAGYAHKGATNNHYTGNIEAGLKYLIGQQGSNGLMSSDLTAHALATQALCEAYGLTADPVLKQPAQRAITAIVTAQHSSGGWGPLPTASPNLFVTAWQVQALKSGHLAGLNVPNATWVGIRTYLDSVGNVDGCSYGFQRPQVSPLMTSMGLLCRQYLGWGPRHPALHKGVDNLLQQPPFPTCKNICYYYHATRVIHNLMYWQEDAWDRWGAGIRDLLIDSQDMDDSPHRGSWPPAGDSWGDQVGRVGVTSLTLLTLLTLEASYLRPLFQRREISAMKDEAIRNAVK